MPRYSVSQRNFSLALSKFLRSPAAMGHTVVEEASPTFQACCMLAYAQHLLSEHNFRGTFMKSDLEALREINRTNDTPVLECPYCK